MAFFIACDGTFSTLTGLGGELTPRCEPVDGSEGWVLVPQEAFLIQNLFDVPPQEDLTQAYMIPMTTILICYMASWAYGKVIQFLNSREV